MKNKAMKTLPAQEQPYEKCRDLGVQALTDIELMAVLIRSGTKDNSALSLSRELIGDSILNIHQLNMESLMRMHGIGFVKGTQILCLSELTKRLARATASQQLSFQSPKTIADYYMEDLRHEQQENMKLLLLNTKSMLIRDLNISKGTVNASMISPRELFIEALSNHAVFIILLHNHPSGDPTPSKEDILFTQRVKSAGALIGIDLLDHIIIGDNCYYSLCEEQKL